MNKFVSLIICFILLLSADVLWAQYPHRHSAPQDDSALELIDDLTPRQKKQLERLYKESRVRIEAIKRDLKVIRDSVGSQLDLYGDHAATIYPLFDREAFLYAELSRELYRVKVKIDNILTKEQFEQYTNKRKALKEERLGN